MIVGQDYFTSDDGMHYPESVILEQLANKSISLERLDSLPWLFETDPATGATLYDRWTLLMRGLLTRDPDRRWGYNEVQEWQRSGSPAVDDDWRRTPPPTPYPRHAAG